MCSLFWARNFFVVLLFFSNMILYITKPKKIVPKIVQRGIKDFFDKNEFNQNVVTSLDKSLSLLNLQDGPTSTENCNSDNFN